MKRLLTLSLSALLLVSATGCEDARAKLNTSNEVVFTIGTQSFTKGQLYTMLNSANNVDVVVNESLRKICASEIETTDEMRKNAESIVESYKTMYGDYFLQSIKASGMSEEDYIENIILSEQQTSLVEKYIDENYERIASENTPVKASVLIYATEENADKALSALKDGSKSVEEVATEFESSSQGQSEIITLNSSYYPAEISAYIRSGSMDDGWQKILGSTDGRYYVVHIDETDVNKIKDEVIEILSTNTTITDDAFRHYFNKYNFHIYDKDLYDAIKNASPHLIVQN